MRLFRSPAGGLLTQPWVDGVVLMLLRRYFFPLSRLWALAREAEGNDERFIAGTSSRNWSPRRVRRLRASLAHFERCRLKAYMTEQLWHDYLFGQRGVALERLLIAEEMRPRHAHRLQSYALVVPAVLQHDRCLGENVAADARAGRGSIRRGRRRYSRAVRCAGFVACR